MDSLDHAIIDGLLFRRSCSSTHSVDRFGKENRWFDFPLMIDFSALFSMEWLDVDWPSWVEQLDGCICFQSYFSETWNSNPYWRKSALILVFLDSLESLMTYMMIAGMDSVSVQCFNQWKTDNAEFLGCELTKLDIEQYECHWITVDDRETNFVSIRTNYGTAY